MAWMSAYASGLAGGRKTCVPTNAIRARIALRFEGVVTATVEGEIVQRGLSAASDGDTVMQLELVR